MAEIRKQKDYKEMYLTVSPKNTPALALYLKNGFEVFDSKKDVYGPGADRLYLRKK